MSKCCQCNQEFNNSHELKFFLSINNIPDPTLCPDCQLQKRLSWRNERFLYNRQCDLCKKDIITMYSPDKPYTVYCPDCWWSDQWDALEYGRDFDFSRSFFEQFNKLLLEVPRLSLINKRSDNSPYCNITENNKNCYFVFGGDNNEDCYNSHFCMNCRDCYDGYWTIESELCFETINCYKSYNLFYSQECHNCRDSFFLYDCRNCHDCFGCAGLRNKAHYIYNKAYSEQKYKEKIEQFDLSKNENINAYMQKAGEIELTIPHKFAEINHCQNVSGDNLNYCENVHNCFNVYDRAHNCQNLFLAGWNLKDSYNSDHVGFNSELCYEDMGIIYSYNVIFSLNCWSNKNVSYSDWLNNCSDVFGCSNLRHKEFCILNKQYSKTEYYKLKEKIIDHMKKTKEYGEFFPAEISFFDYHETLANEYFPKNKKIEIKNNKKVKNCIECKNCGRNFLLQKKEREFYEKNNLAIPNKCFHCRYEDRQKLIRPIKLWQRKCGKCNKKIKTNFSSERKEIIYCEECYQKEIY